MLYMLNVKNKVMLKGLIDKGMKYNYDWGLFGFLSIYGDSIERAKNSNISLDEETEAFIRDKSNWVCEAITHSDTPIRIFYNVFEEYISIANNKSLIPLLDSLFGKKYTKKVTEFFYKKAYEVWNIIYSRINHYRRYSIAVLDSSDIYDLKFIKDIARISKKFSLINKLMNIYPTKKYKVINDITNNFNKKINEIFDVRSFYKYERVLNMREVNY